MTTKYLPPVESLYNQIGLTPVLMVLGGSQSYGHDHPQDEDYFGYHTGEEGVVHTKGDHRKLRTVHIDSVAPALDGERGFFDAMYYMDNWMFHKPVFETDEAMTLRETLVRPYLTPDFAKFYAQSALEFHSASKNNQQGKVWDRAVRMALTAKHLAETGELECNVGILKDKYDSGDIEHVFQLFEEITGLIT